MRISYWIGVWAQVLRTGFIQKTGLLARSNFRAMAATVMQREELSWASRDLAKMAWGWRKAIPTQQPDETNRVYLQETSRNIIYQETVRFRCCCGSLDLKDLGLFVSHSSSSHQYPSQLVAEGFRCPNQLLPWCCRSCRGTCVLLAPGPAADGWGGAGGGWLNCFYFSISHSMCFMRFSSHWGWLYNYVASVFTCRSALFERQLGILLLHASISL